MDACWLRGLSVRVRLTSLPGTRLIWNFLHQWAATDRPIDAPQATTPRLKSCLWTVSLWLTIPHNRKPGGSPRVAMCVLRLVPTIQCQSVSAQNATAHSDGGLDPEHAYRRPDQGSMPGAVVDAMAMGQLAKQKTVV